MSCTGLIRPGPRLLRPSLFLPFFLQHLDANMGTIKRSSRLRGGRPASSRADARTRKQATAGGPSVTAAEIAAVAEARRVELHIRNNAELRANSKMVRSVIHSNRPKNTAASYDPKQREFRAFCRRKQYQDGDTVTEDKLLLFLVEEVSDRPLRGKSRKAAAEVSPNKTRFAWKSVRSYVSAITDL